MTYGDLAAVRQWRNHPDVRQHMFAQHEITPDEHQQVLKALAEKNLKAYGVDNVTVETGDGGDRHRERRVRYRRGPSRVAEPVEPVHALVCVSPPTASPPGRRVRNGRPRGGPGLEPDRTNGSARRHDFGYLCERR